MLNVMVVVDLVVCRVGVLIIFEIIELEKLVIIIFYGFIKVG